MAAIFLAPLKFANAALAADGSTQVSAPVANLLKDHLAMVWRSSAAAPFITLALGGNAIDSVVLWGTNMTASDTVRVRIGPNASGASPVYDQTFPGSTNVLAFLNSPVTASYLRLDFTRANGGATFTEAARLVVGDRVESDGIAKDAEVTYDDQSVRYSGPNWFSADEYSVLQTWKVKVEGLTEDQFFLNGWHDFLMTVGEARPFVFLPYYPATYASKLVSFGAMTTPARVSWITQVDRAVEMSFQTIT